MTNTNINTAIQVEKAAFEYKEQTYYEYFIHGSIRGRDVKIKLAPPNAKDRNAYTVLDIVFGNEERADFIVELYEFLDSSGKTIMGNRYMVRTVDKDTGEVYEANIRPAKSSDKALLAMLMRAV